MIEMNKPSVERVDDKTNPSYAKFEVEPLERGYGITLGNSQSYAVIAPRCCSDKR